MKSATAGWCPNSSRGVRAGPRRFPPLQYKMMAGEIANRPACAAICTIPDHRHRIDQAVAFRKTFVPVADKSEDVLAKAGRVSVSSCRKSGEISNVWRDPISSVRHLEFWARMHCNQRLAKSLILSVSLTLFTVSYTYSDSVSLLSCRPVLITASNSSRFDDCFGQL